MPSVINRPVLDAVEQAVAPAAPESSDARRVSTRTTIGKTTYSFGSQRICGISNCNLSVFMFERRQCLAYTFVEQHGSGARAYIIRSGAMAPMGARNTA